MKSIKILLVDDHDLKRDSLRLLLEAQPNFHVTGEAANGHEALGKVERLRPDVAILDISMPGIDGLETARQICAAHPETRIIVLSMYGSLADILGALRAGTRGYLMKAGSGRQLIQAVRTVQTGSYYLCEYSLEQLLDWSVGKGD